MSSAFYDTELTEMLSRLGIRKPSDALGAMHAGITKWRRTRGFQLSMSMYLAEADGICYGCAATCALLYCVDANEDDLATLTRWANEETVGSVQTPEFDALAEVFSLPYWFVEKFEEHMNNVRWGNVTELAMWFPDATRETLRPWDQRFCFLDCSDHTKELGLLQEVITELRTAGL